MFLPNRTHKHRRAHIEGSNGGGEMGRRWAGGASLHLSLSLTLSLSPRQQIKQNIHEEVHIHKPLQTQHTHSEHTQFSLSSADTKLQERMYVWEKWRQGEQRVAGAKRGGRRKDCSAVRKKQGGGEDWRGGEAIRGKVFIELSIYSPTSSHYGHGQNPIFPPRRGERFRWITRRLRAREQQDLPSWHLTLLKPARARFIAGYGGEGEGGKQEEREEGRKDERSEKTRGSADGWDQDGGQRGAGRRCRCRPCPVQAGRGLCRLVCQAPQSQWHAPVTLTGWHHRWHHPAWCSIMEDGRNQYVPSTHPRTHTHTQ